MNSKKQNFLTEYKSKIVSNVLKYGIAGTLVGLVFLRRPKIGLIAGCGIGMGMCHPILESGIKNWFKGIKVKVE